MSPVNWKPKQNRIQELIAEEQAKLDALQERRSRRVETVLPTPPIARTTLPERTIEPSFIPAFSPAQPRETGWTPFSFPQEDPLTEEEKQIYGYEPPRLPNLGKIIPNIRQEAAITAPSRPAVSIVEGALKPAKEPPASVPFWQRALQVFAAPFNWVDETIIKPGLAVLGTTAGFVPEVDREPGEDFWEWKKRSWAGWETPGININVPWSDKPLRLDVRGVLELAPWLLIPGAGQVGGATGLGARLAGKAGQRAARGLAGVAGRGEKVGRVLGAVAEVLPGLEQLGVRTALGRVTGVAGRVVGTAIEYSPWGLAEKTAGVAIKGGFRAVGAVSARVSTKVGEKLYGKYVPPPVPPEVTKLTEHMKLVAMPSYRAFQKAKGPELRLRQAIKLEEVENAYKRGAIPFEEVQKARDIARKGGIKEEFGLAPEVLVARQEKVIRNVEAQVVSGELSQKQGEALIKQIKENPAFTTRPIVGVAPDDISDMSGFMFSGSASGEAQSNWFSGSIDKVLDFAKGRLKSGRGGEPVVRIYRTSDIEKRGVNKLVDLMETSGKQTPSSEYSMMYLREVEPAFTLKLTRGFQTTKDDIVNQIEKELQSGIGFTKAEAKTLHDMVAEGVEGGVFERAESADAFWDFILKGTLPEKHNLRDWTKVFGDDFAKAVGLLDNPSRVNQVLDALNIPRAIIASWDVSGTARQGLILSLLHPIQAPKWFGRQVKALFSEKWALEIDDVMRADPLWKEFTKTGAYVAPLRGATFTTAEEMFASRTARVVPGIRRSERAFATYLNQARFDAFKSAYNAMSAQGATDAHFKLLGEFLDITSGRGRIPESLDKFMPALNLALFSPRLQAATVQLPRQIGRMLISENPYMRKEAAKALVTFVGGGVGLLSLLNNTGVAKVEKDPRSGDFGKIRFKIGEDANGQPKYSETRLDIWRGYLQYARFAAQLLTGERKSAYANMNKAERGEIAWRFIQSKASPAVGLMVDLLRGELYSGEPIFNDTTGFIKAARGKLIPLAVQDIVDAMEQSGINGVAVAAPALLGVGALTYVNDFVQIKEKIAKEMGFGSWDDIDPKSQREIENRNAELQVATVAFDRQVMGTAWGDWRLAGKAVENIFRQNIDDAVNKYRQDGLGVDFRNKVSDGWTERRGAYKAREAEPRFEDIVKRMKTQDTLESLVGLGPEGTAIRVYQDLLYGDDMFDEFGDYRFDEANVRKELLRQQLGDEMFDYVEQYQGVRYQDFPQEFQDLQEAKKLMKPYWAVADQVVRLFGQRYADSPAGKALIAKRRKEMRLRNPELNKVYERFYAQNT